MFVKQAGNTTLVETFEESIKVEKDSMSCRPERSGKVDTFPRKKVERSSLDKDKEFDVEQLQNAIQALTNEVRIKEN